NVLWKAEGPSSLERHNEGTVQIHLQSWSLPKCTRTEAISLLECWLDRQDNQVGPTFQFKAWIDDKGKMHPLVGKESDDSDGDADNEAVQPMPTKKSRTTVALSLPGHPKDPATEGSEDEDCGGSATNTGYHSPGVHHAGQHAHGFGPHSTRRGLEHIQAPPAAKVRASNKTRATGDASLSVKARLPRKTGATADASPAAQDQSLKKTRVTRSAAYPLSDAPAKRTRSKVDDSLGTRPQQKPKRYADYV
ncbi:uncharacterized protein EDB91DRAFT_1088767, partial [Suillus paluster]|uniref:uncharacterized protein n=1 Tax=Suillus paluster TaxID=48578 RepID=UPI001B861E5E